MRRLLAAILTLFVGFGIEAQEVVWVPATSIGAASIKSITIDNGIEALQPAQCANTEQYAVAVGYTSPFSLSDLGQTHLRAAYNIRDIVCVAADVGHHGNDDSSITTIGGGLSKKWEYFSIGLEYYAITHKLNDNQKFNSSFSRFGFIISPTKELSLSVSVNNVESRKIDYGIGGSFEIEQIALAGVKWQPSQIFSVMAEVEKNFQIDDPATKVAVALYPVDRLQMSVGFCSRGRMPTAGVGYAYKLVRLHVGFAYHQQLGSSTGALITVKPWRAD